MSSDSDSDICDFTSDISKHMSKGNNKFWQDFDKKVANYVDETIDDESQDPDANKNDLTHAKDKENVADTTHLNNINLSLGINVSNRIVDKLNNLSETLTTILEDKSKANRGAKRRKSASTTKKYRLRNKKLNSVPEQTYSENIISSSDEETHSRLVQLNTVQKRTNLKSITVSSSNEGNCSRNIDIKEELNPEVTIKVLWKSLEKHTFKIRKYQTLSCIAEHYVQKFNVNPKLLFFTVDDKRIKLDESSYVSLRLNDKKELEGGILPESYLENSDAVFNPSDLDPLKFKVQWNSKRNKEIIVSCRNDDKLEILFWKISRHIKQPIENIKLCFDGHLVNPSVNICDMDLEEGDCFDLEVVNI